MTPKELLQEEPLSLCQRFSLQCNLAVREEQLGAELRDFLRVYRAEGVSVGLWLLLPKSEGYWPSERNAERFQQAVERTAKWLQKENFSGITFCIDLEPPLAQAQAQLKRRGVAFFVELLRQARVNRNLSRFQEAHFRFHQMATFLQREGFRTEVALFPQIVEDAVVGGNFFQDIVESPTLGVPWGEYNFMVYSTLLQKNIPLFSLEDARAYAYSLAKDALLQLPRERVSLSVGLTGTAGFLGEEPLHAHPEELARDIAWGSAAGVTKFAIYNFEGIVEREEPEKWFKLAASVRPLRFPQVPFRVKLLRSFFQGLARRFA